MKQNGRAREDEAREMGEIILSGPRPVSPSKISGLGSYGLTLTFWFYSDASC